MKKLFLCGLVFAFGICIGGFLVLTWKGGTNSNTDNKTKVPETAPTVISQTDNEIKTKNVAINEKLAEEMHELIHNSYYRSQLLEFHKHGKLINEKSFKVLQVLHNGQALVYGKDEYGYYNGVLYLLIDKEDSDMFDDQIIKVPKGMIVKRHGTYQYTTRNGIDKTVPKIMIMDAN